MTEHLVVAAGVVSVGAVLVFAAVVVAARASEGMVDDGASVFDAAGRRPGVEDR